MKKLACISLFTTFAVSTAHAQASKKAFSKTEAIIWLNAKMQGASKQSDVNSQGESTMHNPKFTNCSYYSKIDAYKMSVYKVQITLRRSLNTTTSTL